MEPSPALHFNLKCWEWLIGSPFASQDKSFSNHSSSSSPRPLPLTEVSVVSPQLLLSELEVIMEGLAGVLRSAMDPCLLVHIRKSGGKRRSSSEYQLCVRISDRRASLHILSDWILSATLWNRHFSFHFTVMFRDLHKDHFVGRVKDQPKPACSKANVVPTSHAFWRLSREKADG